MAALSRGPTRDLLTCLVLACLLAWCLLAMLTCHAASRADASRADATPADATPADATRLIPVYRRRSWWRRQCGREAAKGGGVSRHAQELVSIRSPPDLKSRAWRTFV